MTAGQARSTIWAMGSCAGFDATFAATLDRRYLAGPKIDAPVTLAFGSRDMVLLAHQSRHLDQLPAGTQPQSLPGCGHIPMFDDPDAVAAFIASSAAHHDVSYASSIPG
jgi:pimeloyl-ACP methyl ester carboxylesterase